MEQVKNSDFDLDFSYGKAGEKLVEDLLSGGKTVEVKRDRRWRETNNIYIEVECWYQSSQSWKPSGASISYASHWAFVLETSVILIPTYILKNTVLRHGKEITCEIPPNKSKGFLITVDNLLTETKAQK